MNPFKLALIIFLGFIGVVIAIGIVKSLLSMLWPLILLGVIGFVVYGLATRKSLGSRRGRYLP
ncbi:MAG: hypothetical protein ACK4XJ_12255 [Fimbriimonadaceae bacterium]